MPEVLRFQNILFCTDFSDNAYMAFAYAVEQARLAGGNRLTLLHVVLEPDAQFWQTYLYEVENVDDKGRNDMEAKINADYRSRLPADMTLRVFISTGSAHAKILEFAASDHSDLIVIGRQGHSSIGKVFFGNETEKIVRKARCPVLVVPMQAKELFDIQQTKS